MNEAVIAHKAEPDSTKTNELALVPLVNEWTWLFEPANFTLIAMSPFGDLFMQDRSGAYCLLDINMGELGYATAAGNDPAFLFPMAFDMKIAYDYIKAGLMPEEGQCFGYKRQLVIAGSSLDSANVYVATATEYISFMGDFHRQIQDVPDGASVRLKVINEKVIQ